MRKSYPHRFQSEPCNKSFYLEAQTISVSHSSDINRLVTDYLDHYTCQFMSIDWGVDGRCEPWQDEGWKERPMPKIPADKVGLADLLVQARITNRLLAAQLKATLGQQEMVRLLATTGASTAEIADVLNTTSATVSSTLQRLKKREKEQGVGPGAPAVGESVTSAANAK